MGRVEEDLELEPVEGEEDGKRGDGRTCLRHSAHERGCFFVFLSSCLGRLLASIVNKKQLRPERT